MKYSISVFIFTSLFLTTPLIYSMQRSKVQAAILSNYLGNLKVHIGCVAQSYNVIAHTRPNEMCSFTIDTSPLTVLYKKIDELVGLCEKRMNKIEDIKLKNEMQSLCNEYALLKKAITEGLVNASAEYNSLEK